MEQTVSIVVPVYNVSAYLPRCIESLLRQTYVALQVVLVDDGSTDGSGEMCDEYAFKDARITVIHKQNGGLSSARNAGLEAAKGAYVMFVDSDDWIAPDMVEVLHKACQGAGAQIAECGYTSYFNDSVLYETPCTGAVTIQTGIEALGSMMGEQVFRSIVCNKLYRRQVVEGIRFPAGKLHEDEFVVHHFYLAAQKVAFVDVSKYYYERRREGNITQTFSSARMDGCEALDERMHLVWQGGWPQLQQVMNDRYSFVLFYRLAESCKHGVNDEKVQDTVKTALANWGDMQQNRRPLAERYRPLYEAMEQGREVLCACLNSGEVQTWLK